MKRNALGEWLEEFTVRCAICDKPHTSTYESFASHCPTCEMGIQSFRAMAAAKEDGSSIDVGRGYYAALLVEAMASRIHKLSVRVAELEGGKHD